MSARILVVEDENIVARDIAQTLASHGWEVAGTCGTGEDAIDRARAERPDLVLMDIRLRGALDGIAAATAIRAERDVPIVFLTAFADEDTLRRAQSAAPYGYIVKPFDDADLHAATTMALLRHRAYCRLSAVAELGRYALEHPDLDGVLDRAIALVAEVLDADLAEVLVRRDGGGAMTLRAGVGWPAGVVGRGTVFCDGPGELGAAPLVVAHGGAATAATPIQEWGVLAAHWRDRTPAPDHEAFLGAVASVIASVLVRVQIEQQRTAAERIAEEARVGEVRAQEAIRLRDEFLSIASHELKTPLTSLQLQLQSLVERGGVDERVAGKLARATRSSERLGSLVETLLDVSRISTGRLTLRIEEVDLGDLVEDVVDRLRTDAERAGCAVTAHVDRGVRGHWDRLRLEQIVVNLLANAFKYGAGRPIELAVSREGGDAELRVRDQGLGIAPKDTSRIFERFERAVSSQHYGGLGLGLYVARTLVEAHGGLIVVDSVPAEGATFVVRLPLDARPIAPPPAPERTREVH